MSEEWRDLREGHERLTWARRRSRFETQRDAADSLGMNLNTYSAYERAPDKSKHTPLDHQAAIRFGKKFKVNWVWLLTGWGEPTGDPLTTNAPLTVLEEAMAKAAKAPEAQQELIADIIERMLKAG
jgi:hypothetical protein